MRDLVSEDLSGIPMDSSDDEEARLARQSAVSPEPDPREDRPTLPEGFSGGSAPQLIRTVNLLPVPEHDISGPDEIERIADFIDARAREGIDDVFAHEDYDGGEEPTEAWARAVAEHQTGIPYTMPAYFYDGPQRKIAAAIVDDGRYPLVGQCQQSVTTALCMGGWDGGAYGDIGSGIDAQPACARLGRGWTSVPLALASWPEELWSEVTVGSCLFWSAPCPLTRDGKTCGGGQHVSGCGRGSGHVVMVLRKHPTERKWQLWDTTTSFADPVAHPAAAKGARMLWESPWWDRIPRTMSSGWAFRGIAVIDGLGEVRGGLKPRGRCRLCSAAAAIASCSTGESGCRWRPRDCRSPGSCGRSAARPSPIGSRRCGASTPRATSRAGACPIAGLCSTASRTLRGTPGSSGGPCKAAMIARARETGSPKPRSSPRPSERRRRAVRAPP